MLNRIYPNILSSRKVLFFVILFFLLAFVGLVWYFKFRQPAEFYRRGKASTGIKKGVIEFFDATPSSEDTAELRETEAEAFKGKHKSSTSSVKNGESSFRVKRVPKLNAFVPADVKVRELTTQTIDKIEKPLHGMASGDVIEVNRNGCKLKLSSFVALEAEKKDSKIERTFYFLPPGTNLFLSYPFGLPESRENPFKLKVGERILARVSLAPKGKEAVLLKIEGRKTK